jgi:predicted nucleic acid-binding protein
VATDYLIDTNLLVYTLDRRDLAKQSRAMALLEELRESGTGSLSTQVLAEFFTVVTQRLPEPLPHTDAANLVSTLGDAFPVWEVTLPIVVEATRAVAEHRLSYWDAQIWATAKLNQVPVVLSEDLQGIASLEGVRFHNPLPQG